jgi:hypothetical protein
MEASLLLLIAGGEVRNAQLENIFPDDGTNYHPYSIVQPVIANKCRRANGISMRDEFLYFIAF